MFYKILLLLSGLILLMLHDQITMRRLSKAVLSTFMRSIPPFGFQRNTLTTEVGAIQRIVLPFELQSKQTDLKQLEYVHHCLRQIFERGMYIVRPTEIHIHFQDQNPFNWWESLLHTYFVLQAMENSHVTAFIPQDLSDDDFHPSHLMAALFKSASWGKSTVHSIEFSPDQLLEDDSFSALAACLFTQGWEQSAVLVNLSENTIQLDLSDIFIKDFYAEQISLPFSKIKLTSLSKADLKVQLGKGAGGLTVLPYSLTKLASQYFIPVTLEKNQIDIDLKLNMDTLNQVLNITYQLNQTTRLTLLVFNTLEQIKFSLEKQLQKPGKYNIQLNIQNLLPGKYKVTLISKAHIWEEYFEWGGNQHSEKENP